MDCLSVLIPSMFLQVKFGFQLGTKTIVGISSIGDVDHHYEEPVLEILSQCYPGLKLPQSFSFKHHLGKKFSELELQPSDYLFGTNVSEGLDGFPIFYYENNMHVTLPELLAETIFYLHDKLLSRYEGGRPFSTHKIFFIGIPIYFTDLQRRIVLDAVEKAGFDYPSLVHETTMSALKYMDSDKNVPALKYMDSYNYIRPPHIIYIDMGLTSMQVSVVGLRKEINGYKIISLVFDYTLGGRAFDEVLLNYFVIMFRKLNIDVTLNSEMYREIYNSCERMKMELCSEKKERTWLKINWEDYVRWTGRKDKCEWFIDSRGWYIDQSVFEDLCAPLLERVKGCLQRALIDAGITIHNIDSVRCVGLASKVPAIVNIFKNFFGSIDVAQEESKRPWPTSRESLYCVRDIFPYSIVMPCNKKEATIQSVVFPKRTPLNSIKEVSFSASATFFVDFMYGDVFDPTIPTRIGTFQIGPFQSKTGAKVPGSFTVFLDKNGIFHIHLASISEDGKDVEIPVSRMHDQQVEEANLLIAEPSDNLQRVMDELHEEKEKSRKLQEELAQYQQGSERIRTRHSERRPFYDCEDDDDDDDESHPTNDTA